MQADQSQATARKVLGVVETLARESATRGRYIESVELDSRLEQDLGFDSLSKTELLLRIEDACGVSLPEHALLAETPRDLLRAVANAAGRETRHGADARRFALPAGAGTPSQQAYPLRATTLDQVLEWHLEAHPERIHLYLYGDSDEPMPMTYGELGQGARRVAVGLQERGVQGGHTVAIMLPTGKDYFFSFFGILLAGAVPVPIYPPARPSQIEEHLRRHGKILDNAQAGVMITVAEARTVARLLQSQLPSLRHVVTVEELAQGADSDPGLPLARPGTDDIAFLQYTSGSTGDPKGVILTHANLLANIRAMGQAIRVRPDDVFVSWLPLYHDMGLIGAWLGSVYFAMPFVVMSPLRFLARPSRWLWAIHRHRGSLSASPNFGYELCMKKLDEAELKGLDLSSWRRAFNGAEPVSAVTLDRFARRFGPHGLPANALAPVYGLAEAAVGLCFPPPERGPRIDWVERETLTRRGQAQPVAEGDAAGVRMVGCGLPLPGYEVRVVDTAGNELPERREGHLQFKGPSTTSGYYRNPEASARLFDGDWLNSGDRAYIAEGEVFITGRVKDLIIRAGRNIYPYELEQAIGEIQGIRKGCIAVFSSAAPEAETERLVVVAETRDTAPEALDLLRRRIQETTMDLLALPADDIRLVPPHTVLKTSSGKIRRAATRDLYERGLLDRANAGLTLQMLRLARAGIGPMLRRLGERTRTLGYAARAWTLFLLLTPPVWLAVAVLPKLPWRWRLIRAAIGLLRRGAGIPLRVAGLERLPPPDSHCILVVNHSSYLDALGVIEAIPRPLRFVAKRELLDSFVSRVFLQRLDTLFVERFDLQRSADEAKDIGARVRDGASLVFFPEGTFRRMPGLLPFRMGAFIAAAGAGVPVVPVTLRGTRSILRGDSRLPHRGMVQVVIGAPLYPQGKDWSAALALRDGAREEILRHCGEPDLGGQE